jgi:hypothetical protein
MGDTQIPIVVAGDTTFVEHPGNAGRPHAAARRPIPSLHRPSGWSRSFVLASLRALHLDQRLRPGAQRQEGLDRPSLTSYNRRTGAERSFSTLKDPATTDTRRGWCRLLGTTKNLIALACAAVIRNLRVLASYQHRHTGHPRPHRRTRRRTTQATTT